MTEIESQLRPSGIATPRELAAILWERKWIIIWSTILSLSAAGLYCLITPNSYRSETMILVEEQKIPENYVKGVDEGNLEQRIFVIQRQVNSRGVLGDIVSEFNLYPEVVAKYGLDGAIATFASNITVEMVAKGPRGNFVGRNSIDAFTISFVHQDPGTAMQVTARIASKFIEENLRTRELTAEGTTAFFDDEVARAKNELERKENEISEFKSKHMGELPQQIEANLRALDRLQSDLSANNENIQRLTDRVSLIEKAIQDYQRSGVTNAALVTGQGEPDPLFRRLKELREKLVKLKAEFWDTYPEVIVTEEEIRQVETQLLKLYGSTTLKAREKGLDPYLEDLKKQLSETRSELAVSKKRLQSLHLQRKEYEVRVETAPEVEQNLLVLERDYENMKNNYRALLDKRLNARVAENLEKRQKGAQFRVLDTANFPRVPEKPNRPRIMILGLLFGCAIGTGIVLLKELLNPQFRRPEDVEHILEPQLLAVIPDFSLTDHRSSWQRLLAGQRLHGNPHGNGGTNLVKFLPWRQAQGSSGYDRTILSNFVVRMMPHTIVAEQYRVAATRLTLLEREKRSLVVAVTSSIKGEGKTTTVLNLGYTLARDLGKRTLLLDCDFVVPMLNRYIDTSPPFGLADCLTHDIPISECLTGFGEVPCWIMPVGSADIPSTELLKAERLPRILEELRKQFEYILINTPPILPLATMNILSEYVDHLLLIVRANATPHHIVRRAMKSLDSKVPIHIILNGVTSQSLPHYMYDYVYLQNPGPRSYEPR